MSEKRKRAALQRILDASARRWEEVTRFNGYAADHPEVKTLEKVMRIARGGLGNSARAEQRQLEQRAQDLSTLAAVLGVFDWVRDNNYANRAFLAAIRRRVQGLKRRT